MTRSAISFARFAPRASTLSMYNLSARFSPPRLRVGPKYFVASSGLRCLTFRRLFAGLTSLFARLQVEAAPPFFHPEISLFVSLKAENAFH